MGVMAGADGMEVVEGMAIVGDSAVGVVAMEGMEVAPASYLAGVPCTALMVTSLPLVSHATSAPHLSIGGSRALAALSGGTQV